MNIDFLDQLKKFGPNSNFRKTLKLIKKRSRILTGGKKCAVHQIEKVKQSKQK